jgi:hypothetical protein
MPNRAFSESGIQMKDGARKSAKNRFAKQSSDVSKAKTRRFTIEIKDVKSGAIVLSTTVEWSSDQKSLGVAMIYRMANELTEGD